jgi:hypothetical protein
MRKMLTSLLMVCVFSQPLALAAEATRETNEVSVGRYAPAPSQKLTLSASIEREAMLFAQSLSKTAVPQSQAPASEDRGWIRRHPVLFGTLIGAGAGLVFEQTNCGLSSCHGLVTGAFAAVGAYGGLVASAMHKVHLGQPVGKKMKMGLIIGAVAGAGVGAFMVCYGSGGCGEA